MALHQLVLADTPRLLQRSLADLADLGVVGVDVERADWDRYWRRAALIQVGGEGRVALVDPLALRDLRPLSAFLTTRTCVLHALDNDLAPLAQAGVELGPMEDTSIAAALLGLPTGLEGLLRARLDVVIAQDKQVMQRADWEARPLTPEMLAYAAGDVADLPALWADLWAQLEQRGRTGWYREELSATLAQPSVEQRRDWSRTKGAGRLDPHARGRLQALWDAREALARAEDAAPGRIAADKVLLDLAERPPADVRELAHRGMRHQAARAYGQQLLAALHSADAAVPARQSTRPPTEADRVMADRLRALRSAKAAEVGIDPGLLCPSRTLLSALLTDPRTPEDLRVALGLRGWQWELLREVFCEALDIDTKEENDGRAAQP